MIPKLSQLRDELVDRESIRDCLFRYCRGIDRSDREVLASAFWPDAIDHGSGFSGTTEEFVEWAMPLLAAMERNLHIIGNVLIRLDGDHAKAESCFWSVSVIPGQTRTRVLTAGRYNDRFEKRDDEWRIVERWVVHDWFERAPETGDWSVGPFGMAGLLLGAAKPDDPSYSFLGLD